MSGANAVRSTPNESIPLTPARTADHPPTFRLPTVQDVEDQQAGILRFLYTHVDSISKAVVLATAS